MVDILSFNQAELFVETGRRKPIIVNSWENKSDLISVIE